MGKQDSINTSISLGRNKRESACMGSGKGESRVQGRNKTVYVCISIHVHAVPVLLHFVIVLCLCECVCVCRGGKRENEEETSTSNSLCDSLSVFDSERGSNKEIGKEEVIIVDCTQAGLYLPSVYIRGVRISCKECGYSYGTERTRVHYERERTVPLILHLAFVL